MKDIFEAAKRYNVCFITQQEKALALKVGSVLGKNENILLVLAGFFGVIYKCKSLNNNKTNLLDAVCVLITQDRLFLLCGDVFYEFNIDDLLDMNVMEMDNNREYGLKLIFEESQLMFTKDLHSINVFCGCINSIVEGKKKIVPGSMEEFIASSGATPIGYEDAIQKLKKRKILPSDLILATTGTGYFAKNAVGVDCIFALGKLGVYICTNDDMLQLITNINYAEIKKLQISRIDTGVLWIVTASPAFGFENDNVDNGTFIREITKLAKQLTEETQRYIDPLGAFPKKDNNIQVEILTKKKSEMSKEEPLSTTPKKEYELFVDFLNECGREVEDASFKSQMEEIGKLLENIFVLVEEDAANKPYEKKLYSYYLPILKKLVQTYMRFCGEEIESENAKQTIMVAKEGIDTLKEGFYKLYENLFVPTMLDLETEISAMETKLNLDSLR